MEFTNNLEEAEKYDKFKTKVLKFVLYKKRTEDEVRKKFENEENSYFLDDTIEFLKEYNYINDEEYIERTISEFNNLKNLSIKEINYKLMQKGVNRNILENYMSKHRDELLEYELKSAKNIYDKKIKSMEPQDIKDFLYKKGYLTDTLENIF